MDAIIDGSFTLSQTLSAIQYREGFGFALTSLSQGQEQVLSATQSRPVNHVSFNSVDAPPTSLDLVPVPNPGTVASIISERAALGWMLLLYSTIYVEGRLTAVAAFRKST